VRAERRSDELILNLDLNLKNEQELVEALTRIARQQVRAADPNRPYELLIQDLMKAAEQSGLKPDRKLLVEVVGSVTAAIDRRSNRPKTRNRAVPA
jgi:hypothetical protein